MSSAATPQRQARLMIIFLYTICTQFDGSGSAAAASIPRATVRCVLGRHDQAAPV
jgi:hypothetical protein